MCTVSSLLEREADVAYAYTASAGGRDGTLRFKTVAGNRKMVYGLVTFDGTSGEFFTGLRKIVGATGTSSSVSADNLWTHNVDSKTADSDRDGNGGWIDISDAAIMPANHIAIGV